MNKFNLIFLLALDYSLLLLTQNSRYKQLYLKVKKHIGETLINLPKIELLREHTYDLDLPLLAQYVLPDETMIWIDLLNLWWKDRIVAILIPIDPIGKFEIFQIFIDAVDCNISESSNSMLSSIHSINWHSLKKVIYSSP